MTTPKPISRFKLFDEPEVHLEMDSATENKNINANQPVELNKDLSLNLADNKIRNYGLTILFEEDDEANEIKYELSVTCLGLSEASTILYRIDKTSPVYVNELIPDLVADKLAYEAGKVFYPLIIETDKNSAYLNVKNINEIQSRWPKIKENLKQYYEGEYAEKYFELMDLRLNDENFIQIIFKEDWFIKVYFQSIYKSYTKQLSLTEYLTFANLDATTFGYKTEQSISKQTNHFGAIELEHKGVLEQDEINFSTGNYHATYYLAPTSKSIQIIVGEWTVKEINEKKITFKLFSMDNKEEEKIPTHIEQSSINSLVFLDGNQSAKTSFWDKWF